MKRGWFWLVVAINFIAIAYEAWVRHDVKGTFVYLQGMIAGMGIMFWAFEITPRPNLWPLAIVSGVLAVMLAAMIRG